MNGFVGEIVARKRDAVLVRVPEVACGCGCACGCRAARVIELPPADGRSLNVRLRPGDQCVLLANTLFFPLCGFIAGAILAQWIFASDLPAFAGAVAGLGAGVLACRRQSFDRVVIEEVLNV